MVASCTDISGKREASAFGVIFYRVSGLFKAGGAEHALIARSEHPNLENRSILACPWNGFPGLRQNESGRLQSVVFSCWL